MLSPVPLTCVFGCHFLRSLLQMKRKQDAQLNKGGQSSFVESSMRGLRCCGMLAPVPLTRVIVFHFICRSRLLCNFPYPGLYKWNEDQLHRAMGRAGDVGDERIKMSQGVSISWPWLLSFADWWGMEHMCAIKGRRRLQLGCWVKKPAWTLGCFRLVFFCNCGNRQCW